MPLPHLKSSLVDNQLDVYIVEAGEDYITSMNYAAHGPGKYINLFFIFNNHISFTQITFSQLWKYI